MGTVTTGSTPTSSTIPSGQALSAKNEKTESENETVSDATNPFDAITKAGLAGILAITLAEAIFWALGYPAALIYYKITANEWIDVFSKDGAMKAAGFSVGYGGFATAILQYRVTIAAIPLIPVMDKYAVPVIQKFFGDKFGSPVEERVEEKGNSK